MMILFFVFRQDSSMLLFTSSSRYPIKKSISDRPNQLSDSSKSPNHTRLFHSDTTTDNTTKKSSLSFHFFDSILSRSTSKSMSIKISQQKSSIETSSSSCPPTSNIQLPEQARCLYHYNAIKQDEICVHRGEYVHIITFDQDNRWFVCRTSTMIKGWLPGFVLGLKYPNSVINKDSSPLQLPTSSLSSNNLNHL